MRKAWMLAGVLMGTGAVAAEQPEQAVPLRNVVALEVAGLLQNTLGLSAERAVTERLSVRVGLRTGLRIFRMTPEESPGINFASEAWGARELSVGIEPGVRYFLTGRAPAGLWVGPQLRLGASWNRMYSEPNGGGSSVVNHTRFLGATGSALAGYSAVLGRGVTLQAAAGLGATYERWTGDNTAGLSPARGSNWTVRPETQLSLGYAF